MSDPQINREGACAFDGHVTVERPDEQTIVVWLLARIADRVGIAPEEIDRSGLFAAYGLTSRDAVSLSGELEVWLGCPVSATLLYEHPTIDALASHLSSGAASPTNAILPMDSSAELIAVIGMACRFPGANTPEEFWNLLQNGRDATGDMPEFRRGLLQPLGEERLRTKTPRRGGFLAEVDGFDARFFGISPREASRMDPQQRILLETAWEALEDAGQVPSTLAGTRAGVFVGISNSDYGNFQLHHPALAEAYVSTGSALSITANRISYCFDFQGPSMAVDTACSSSLVAVHLACRSLRDDESTLALVGGANLILSPALTINLAEAGFLASDGRCKAFDARADGYARGEGVAIIVLKRLSDALAGGDPIRAVIRGSAIHQDGRSNGLTAPSRQSQETVLRQAYRCASVSPSRVHYVEAHGTGTELGDPIEALALGSVLATDRRRDRPCVVGSVKTNIGHLEAAAGIAGLMKACLMLERRMVPASLHFEIPSPHIPFDDLLLRVPTVLEPWPNEEGRALAGVSSFGFGGMNAHIVVEEPSPPVRVADPAGNVAEDDACFVPLSARSPEALRSTVEAWSEFLAATAGSAASLDGLSYTACVRRTHHDHRIAFVVRSRDQLIDDLNVFLNETEIGEVARVADAPPKLVFVFSGQGAQWWGMGRELLKRDRAFRAAMVEIDDVLREFTSWSLLDSFASLGSSSRLDEADVAQETFFALQVALAALLRSWGIAPDAVVGHSLGEVAAAHVAGALSLRDAAHIVSSRSFAMGRARGFGRTAALELSLAEVERAIADFGRQVSVAAHNGPTSVAVSGDSTAVERLLEEQQRRGVFGRLLSVDYAFHGEQMEMAAADVERALEGLQPRIALTPLYSTVTGRLIDGRALDAAHWGRNVRQPVLFAAAVDHLANSGHQVFVEIGPHPVLGGAIDASFVRRKERAIVLPTLSRGGEEKAGLLQSLSTLHKLGHSVEWSGLFPSGGKCVSIPTYRWEEDRFWLPLAATARRLDEPHPLLGRAIHSARPPFDFIWEKELSVQSFPFLQTCRIDGTILMPISAYLGMTLAVAAEVIHQGKQTRIRNLKVCKPLVLPKEGLYTVQVVLSGTGSERSIFIHGKSSLADPSWHLHAQATMHLEDGPDPVHESLECVGSRCRIKDMPDCLYSAFEAQGFHHGALLRSIQRMWRGDAEALTELVIDNGAEGDELLHRPGLLDVALQVLAVSAAQPDQRMSAAAYLPIAVEEIIVRRSRDFPIWCYVRSESCAADDGAVRIGHISLFDKNGGLSALLRGVRAHQISAPDRGSAAAGGHPSDKGRIGPALLAAPTDQRPPMLESYLRAQVAAVLRLTPLRIPLNQPLRDLGLDSLMAIMLRNRIYADLEVRLPLVQLLGNLSLTQLAVRLLEQTPVEQPVGTIGGFEIGRHEAATMLRNLDRLPDAEVEALLDKLISRRN